MKIFVVVVALGSFTTGARAQTVPQEVAQRINAVESGLVPMIEVAGRGLRMTLPERMAYYGVPGVSVAVINNYTVEGAKGYGVQEVDRRVVGLNHMESGSPVGPAPAMITPSI